MRSGLEVLGALENRDGRRLRGRVTQADVHRRATTFAEECFALSVKDDIRFAGFFPADLDVLPAELRANASAEGLGNSFLSGKTRSEKWSG